MKEKGPEVKASADGASPATPTAAERVSGQVIGPDGKPVAGATVIATRSRDKTQGLGGTDQGARTYQSVRRTTDANGRFTLDLEAPATDVNIDPDSPEADQRFQVVAMARGLGLSLQTPGQPIRLPGDDLPITGRLVDLEGRPVAGARVQIRQLFLRPAHAGTPGGGTEGSTDPRVGRPMLEGEPIVPGGVATDADGRFRIEGLGRETMAVLEISGRRGRVPASASDDPGNGLQARRAARPRNSRLRPPRGVWGRLHDHRRAVAARRGRGPRCRHSPAHRGRL